MEPMRATRLVRRSATVTGVAAFAWLSLAWISSEVPALRAASPWSDDPADAVVSLAFLLVGLVAAVTFVRVQRDARAATMSPATADDVVRGLFVVLGGVAVAEATQLFVFEVGPRANNPAALLLGSLLAVSVTTLIVAALVTVRAARATAAWRAIADQQPRDALDDIVVWLRELAESPVPRRFGSRHLLPLAGWLAAFLDGPFSPRRNPWLFAVLVAVAFGVSVAAWHMVAGGFAPVSEAMRFFLVFGGISALAVVAGWTAFGRYLRLIRQT